jgi:hypothetical protein
MANENAIKAALVGLDPKNDDIWTSSGQPLVDAVRKAVGDDTITRQDITNADPTFSREAALAALGTVEEQTAPPAEPEVKVQPPVVDPDAGKTNDDEPEEVKLSPVEKAKAVLEAKRLALEAAQRDLKKAQDAADAEIMKADAGREKPHIENMRAIQTFIKSQTEQRMQKAMLAQDLRKVGITPEMFRTGSRLDQAMARRRDRGMNRPNLLHQGGARSQ